MKALRGVSVVAFTVSFGSLMAAVWTNGLLSDRLVAQGLILLVVGALSAVAWIE